MLSKRCPSGYEPYTACFQLGISLAPRSPVALVLISSAFHCLTLLDRLFYRLLWHTLIIVQQLVSSTLTFPVRSAQWTQQVTTSILNISCRCEVLF